MNAFTDFPIEENDRHTELTAIAGQIALTTDFPIFTDHEVKIVRNRSTVNTALIDGLDFAVTAGIGNPLGFTITLTVPAEAGDIYTIDGDADFERSSDYPVGRALSTDALNGDMDRSVLRDQELRRDVDLLQANPLLTLNTNRLVGRTSPNAGPPEEVAPGYGLILDNVNGIGTGASLPAGGITDQILVKKSSVDYDVEWKASEFLPVSNGTNDEAMLLAALMLGPVNGQGRTYIINTGWDISSVTNPRLTNIKLVDNAPSAASRLIYFDGGGTNSLYLDHVIIDRGTNYAVGDINNAGGIWCINALHVEALDCEVYGGGAGKNMFFYNCGRVKIIRPYIHDTHTDWNGTGAVPEEQIEAISLSTCLDVMVSGHRIHRMLYNIQWAPGQYYDDSGVRVWYDANSYKVLESGHTSGSTPPTHTSGSVVIDGTTYIYTGPAANAMAPQQTRGVTLGACSNVLIENGFTTFVSQAVDVSGALINQNITLAHNHYEDCDNSAEAFKHQIYNAKTIGANCVRCGASGIVVTSDAPPEQIQSLGIYDYHIADTGGVNPVDSVSGGNWPSVNGISIATNWASGIVIGDGRIDDQQMGTCTISIAAPAVITRAAHGKSIGQPVRFNTTGALPTGLTPLRRVWVVPIPPATTIDPNAFCVSETKGGPPIATTGTQSGTQTVSMPTITSLIRIESTGPEARVRIGNLSGQIWKLGKINGTNFDLSDVERGTFSPTIGGIVGTTITPVTGQVYSAQSGTWTRTGDMAEFEIILTATNLGAGPAGTDIAIVNLNDFPWTFASNAGGNYAVRADGITFTAGYTAITAFPVGALAVLKLAQNGSHISPLITTWSALSLPFSLVVQGRARILNLL